MAGLLDIFGTGGTETLSLLGMSPAEIQRNRDDAQAQALYGLAARLFQGGNTGQSIAEGLQQGQKLYSAAMQNQLQDQLQSFQMKDLIEKRKREKQAEERQAMIDRAVAGAYQPGQAAIPAQMVEEDGRYMGETPAVAAMPAGFDLQSLAPVLMASPQGRKALNDFVTSEKLFRPEYKEVGGMLYEIPTLGGEIKQVAGTKKRDTVTVGNVVLDKDTMAVLYTAPDAPSGSIKEFQDFEKLTPAQKRAYLALQENKRPVTNLNMPSEGERKSAVLANRMNFGVMQMNEAIGKSPNAAMPNTAAEAARFFTGSDFLANKLTPEQRQVVETAQLDVLDAALTLGTGAAYTREQLEGYKKSYFPQLNDKPEAIKMKQKRLENLLKSAEISTGRASSNVPTKMPSPFEIPTLDSILGAGRPRGGN